MMTGHHVRLLMLEDNPRDAELIERHLRRAQLDFSLSLVDDEQGFRSVLENNDPDLILSDYHLPGFDGVTALRIAKILAPSTPFIFVSGSIGEERAVEALREGATDYVLKDRLSRLPSAIVRALAERRERQLRQNVESALRASEQRFQYAAAATREIIWDWNLSTARIWFSAALRDHWGYSSEYGESDSDWFEKRIHPDDRRDVVASFQEAVAHRERWTAEFRFARADESYTNVLSRGMVVTDLRGEPVRMIGAVLDITERLHLENQLEQVRRIESLGRVAATVAHEFNNVLMGILPVAEVMARTPDGGPAIQRMAGLINDSIMRGRRLTEQILNFSKPVEPALIPTPLDSWLTDNLSEMRSLAGKRIEINLNAPPGLVVSIDAPQMQQVLSNLIVNARQAMPEGGKITIGVEPDAETAALSITDDGTGMPLEIVERIFEPLFTTKRSGTGLGLAVAQQIVARHNGTIRVLSKEGKGTTFQILLPLSRVEAMSWTGTKT
ncbi:MAG TPA: ATP-binding protein [Thermoanaerobaculia bacterium]|jgi:PAS domain S-box-containing protein|nr:ATP-binding protein [Thermoanaerobaculia bacterium]